MSPRVALLLVCGGLGLLAWDAWRAPLLDSTGPADALEPAAVEHFDDDDADADGVDGFFDDEDTCEHEHEHEQVDAGVDDGSVRTAPPPGETGPARSSRSGR